MLAGYGVLTRHLSRCISRDSGRHLAVSLKWQENGHPQGRRVLVQRLSGRSWEQQCSSRTSCSLLLAAQSSNHGYLQLMGQARDRQFTLGSQPAAGTRLLSSTTDNSGPSQSNDEIDNHPESQTREESQVDDGLSDLDRLTSTIQGSSSTKKAAQHQRAAATSASWGNTNDDLRSTPSVTASTSENDSFKVTRAPYSMDPSQVKKVESMLKQFTNSTSVESEPPKERHPMSSSEPILDILDPGFGPSNRQKRQDKRKDDGFLRRMRKWVDTFSKLRTQVRPDQVLFVSCLNKNLIERDFVRLISRDPTHRPFVRVIPLRDLTTLDKTDQYLIIFHDKESLEAWRAHVNRLGFLSSKYTMRTLSHPEVAPQRDFILRGEKVDQLVKSYALTPPGSQMLSNYNPDRLDESRNKVSQAGGYGGLVDAEGERRNGVLLRITGVHDMNLADLLQTIVYDGKLRNMSWTILLGEKSRFSASAVPWDAELQTRRVKNMTAKLAPDSAVKHDSGPKKLFDNSSFLQPDSPTTDIIHEALQPSDQAARYHDGERWVVYFHEAHDANRFARTWNRKPLPLPPLDDPQYQFSDGVRQAMERDGGRGTKVYAEALW